MPRIHRAFPASVVVVLSLLVPTASSAPAAEPSGSLVQVSGRRGCAEFTARFGCARLRGDFGPHSVAISADGSYVYTSGVHSIHAFRRDPTTGELTQLRGADGCLVVDDPLISGGPRDGCAFLEGVTAVTGAMAIGPEGRTAYVPVAIASSRAESPTVVSFSRDPETGALRQSPDPPLCVRVRSNEKCLYLKEFWATEAIVSRDGRNLYLASDGATWVFARDPVAGALKQVPTPAGCLKTAAHRPFACTEAAAGAVAAESPDGMHLYALPNVFVRKRQLHSTVAVVRRDSVDGALAPLAGKAGCVSSTATAQSCASARGLKGVNSVAVSVDGRHLYAISYFLKVTKKTLDTDATIVVLRRSATDELAQPRGAAGCVKQAGRLGCAKGTQLGPLFDVTLSPDDRHVYVSAWDAVAVFRRNRATGALTPLPGAFGCVSGSGRISWDDGATCTRARALENPSMARVSPDGRHVYVVSGSAIVAFRRAP